LPSPPEQIENLLLWLGDNLRVFGESIHIRPETHSAVIGAANVENFLIVAKELIDRGLFHGEAVMGPAIFGSLSLQGWQAYEELRRGRSTARKAFMAMVYGSAELDRAFANCFRPAVRSAGFSLRRLDESSKAGLIDNQLRVEIRTSRFLIADLTEGNQGAYWEAGYAEGLGKPVIYTCEKAFFDKHRSHFDTEHHYTVLWEHDRFEDAAFALTTTIRATLPDEAQMEDTCEDATY